MQFRVLVAAAVLVSGLALTGCASVEEALNPDSAEVLVETTVAAPEAPLEGELAAETPENLPLWPESRVEYSEYTEGSYSLSVLTSDPFDVVVNGVAIGLERAEWTAEADEVVGEPGSRVALLTVRSGGNEGFITVTEIGDGTTAIEYLLTVPE